MTLSGRDVLLVGQSFQTANAFDGLAAPMGIPMPLYLQYADGPPVVEFDAGRYGAQQYASFGWNWLLPTGGSGWSAGYCVPLPASRK